MRRGAGNGRTICFDGSIAHRTSRLVRFELENRTTLPSYASPCQQMPLAREVKDMDGFFTVPDFLTAFAVSRTEFYRQVQANKIRLTKIGRSSRVAKADAAAWAASLPTIGGEA